MHKKIILIHLVLILSVVWGDIDSVAVSNKKEPIGDMLGKLIRQGGGEPIVFKGKVSWGEQIVIIDNSGKREIGELKKWLRRRTPGLRKIYGKFSKTNPNKIGKIEVDISMDRFGNVFQLTKNNSTMSNVDFENDILSKIKEWNFGKVLNGESIIRVVFSFGQ